MRESWVNLSCPSCTKSWSDTPSSMPDLDSELVCPDCERVAPLAEFLNTSRDLEIYKSLSD